MSCLSFFGGTKSSFEFFFYLSAVDFVVSLTVLVHTVTSSSENQSVLNILCQDIILWSFPEDVYCEGDHRVKLFY
jgi:hypothetical protein